MAGAVTLNLRAVDNVSPALKKANASAQTFNKTVVASKGNLKQANVGLVGFGAAAKGAGSAALAATPGILGMGAAMQAALGPIVLVTGGLGAIAAAAGTLANLDEASAKFRTLGGDSDALQANLQGVAEELNNSVSVVELMAGSYDVASAGFTDAADATEILKAAALGAKGGFSDLTTTSGALVKVMNAYGLAAEDAGTLMDKFVQTQNDGIITVDQYSQGIGKVASVASMLKVPLEEVNAAIALSTKAGVNSEVAFTGMKTALLRLTGSRGAQKLEKLGIDISAASIEANGFAAELKKLEGMDIKVLEQIFGQEAIQTMAPVLNNMKEFEQLIRNQENAVGTAKDAHDEMTLTMKGAWQELTNIFTNTFTKQTALSDLITMTIKLTSQGLNLIISLLNPVLEILNEILEAFVKMFDWIGKIKDRAGDWLLKLLGKAESDSALDKASENMKEINKTLDETNPKLKENNKLTTQQNEELERQKALAEELKGIWANVGKTIKDGVTDSIVAAIKGSKTMGEVMGQVLTRIADKAMEVAINMALWGGATGGGGLFGGLFKSIFGSAQGGTIGKGSPRVVGERGPEIFVPHSSGKVIPNNRMGGDTNISINVDASDSTVDNDAERQKQLGAAISAAVQNELVRQKMPGGILYA